MSAAEIIEQAKRLSVEERESLIESLLELAEEDTVRQLPPRKSQWPDTLERAKRICGGRVLPNMVLEERESSPY